MNIDWTQCTGPHSIHVNSAWPNWGYNGNPDLPTFTPSVLARGVERPTEEEHATLMAGGHVEPRPFVCHSFVTDGRIHYLSDCTYALAGQTVNLPEWDRSWLDW
jgi:hypothetical protein